MIDGISADLQRHVMQRFSAKRGGVWVFYFTWTGPETTSEKYLRPARHIQIILIELHSQSVEMFDPLVGKLYHSYWTYEYQVLQYL